MNFSKLLKRNLPEKDYDEDQDRRQNRPSNTEFTPVKLVPRKFRYPQLKPILKAHGFTYKAIYLQMHPMRYDQFSHIICGDVKEPNDFNKVLLAALAVIGIKTTLKELRRKD